MKDFFSKPSADITAESADYGSQDARRLAAQRTAPGLLSDAPARAVCLLCGMALNSAAGFDHRGVAYAECPGCGHVQTRVQPPPGYPAALVEGVGFDTIYPALNPAGYVSRCDRVYEPKLQWILEVLRDEGWSDADLKAARWADFGAGAGYFLYALQRFGAHALTGIEANETLVGHGNAMLGNEVVRRHGMPLDAALRSHPADILSAFFVLEHIDPVRPVWRALAEQPKGTIFVFAAPCRGFATLLETALPDFAARNLDNLVHTQLYTDRSIAYALEHAGYEPLARWTFGQDATDLTRMLTRHLQDQLDVPMMEQTNAALSHLIDPLQSAIDRALMADARHVIAIKAR